MRIDVISIFPEYLSGLRLSLIGKALERDSLICVSMIYAIGRTTGTVPSTTPRTVGEQAW